MSARNPFKPGPGITPPYLTGRKEERLLIANALNRISKPLVEGKPRGGPMWPIKIIGLQGAGKTALLDFALEQAQQQGILVLNYDHLPYMEPWDSEERMARRILADRATEKNTAVQNESGACDQNCEEDFPLLLEEMVREKPVLLMLDEPRHDEVRQLAVLLLEIQRMQVARLPLAVLVAGTPMLNMLLSLFNPSLTYDALNCRIHHLSDAEVREALREPFLQHGVQVSEDALELLASWTDNYPYFVQLAGEKAWDALEDADCFELDMEIAQRAAPAMRLACDDYYQSMLVRIEKGGLLSYASHVLTLIEAAGQPLYPEQLRPRLAEAAGLEEDHCRVVFAHLLDLGVVWTTDDDKVIAGMPSFYSFVKTIQQREGA